MHSTNLQSKYFKSAVLSVICLILLFAISACSRGQGAGEKDSTGELSSQISSQNGSDSDSEKGSAGADFIYWNQTGKEGQLAFATEDLDGNEVTSEDFKDARLILVNYWEPWCGPCVSEMPDLEQLYEKYQDQGFLILGVFSSADMDEDARSILSDSGTTYPVLRSNRQFLPFMTGYYPTSFFVDGSGKVLSGEPVIGAQTYDQWDDYIRSYLGE